MSTKITKAGLYDISIDDYHGNCTVGVSVSKSSLPIGKDDPPAKAWARSYLNPLCIERDSEDMSFGRAAHALVLGEPEFQAGWFVAPHEKFNSNPGKQWHDGWKKTVEDGKEVRALVRPSELSDIRAMAHALKITPQTAQAFQGDGKPELSIIWQDDETGLWLKARPDWLPEDPQTHFIREYKTCVTIEPSRLSNDAFKYAYDCQAAMMFDGVCAITGKRPLGIAHIVQEKEPPYLCDLKMFSPEQIEAGRTRYRHALRVFARCLARMRAGDPPHIAWPGYTTEPSFFDTPQWIINQVVEMEDDVTSTNEREFGAILAAG